MPITLAHHLELGELVESRVDLGDARGRVNAGDKMLTLVASALAGGDCIDDADTLRAGATEQVLCGTVKAPSTLGTSLRSFRWGHMRQLDRVSQEVLVRAWGLCLLATQPRFFCAGGSQPVVGATACRGVALHLVEYLGGDGVQELSYLS